MKTVFNHTPATKWHVIDAGGKALGRVATLAARILQGKNRVDYTPHVFMNDNVIIINADKAVTTGKKETKKIYYSHSQYMGSLRGETYLSIIKRKPTFPMEHAVKGMLPKTKLGRQMFRSLHVFAGAEHKHHAQKPILVEVDD